MTTYLYQQYPAKARPAIPATLQPITITRGRTFEEIKTLGNPMLSRLSITWQKKKLLQKLDVTRKSYDYSYMSNVSIETSPHSQQCHFIKDNIGDGEHQRIRC